MDFSSRCLLRAIPLRVTSRDQEIHNRPCTFLIKLSWYVSVRKGVHKCGCCKCFICDGFKIYKQSTWMNMISWHISYNIVLGRILVKSSHYNPSTFQSNPGRIIYLPHVANTPNLYRIHHLPQLYPFPKLVRFTPALAEIHVSYAHI